MRTRYKLCHSFSDHWAWRSLPQPPLRQRGSTLMTCWTKGNEWITDDICMYLPSLKQHTLIFDKFQTQRGVKRLLSRPECYSSPRRKDMDSTYRDDTRRCRFNQCAVFRNQFKMSSEIPLFSKYHGNSPWQLRQKAYNGHMYWPNIRDFNALLQNIGSAFALSVPLSNLNTS
jgi:hypothetical protein